MWFEKEAEKTVKKIITTPPYSQRTGKEWSDAIEKALNAAYDEAVDAAIEIASDHNGCIDTKCLSESNCGATITNQLLALKSPDEKREK